MKDAQTLSKIIRKESRWMQNIVKIKVTPSEYAATLKNKVGSF